MKRSLIIASLIAAGLLASLLWPQSQFHIPATAATNPSAAAVPPAAAVADATAVTPAAYEEAGFRAGEAGLSPSARAGREIWYKATAGNDRFHTYVFQQRIGVSIDWFRVLRSDQRQDRFRAWGAINDPGCCTPGSPDCPAKRLEETYGLDWCPGDEELLKHVGRNDYRDPACDFKDAPLDPGDVHGPSDQRQSTCDLKFGTSSGVLGIRKFPNPKFDRAAWEKLNGGLASWSGFNRRIADPGTAGEAAASHLSDGSIEPPFLIGTACGSCHIAFDPLNPPADPTNPKWENIKGLVGNQYSRISEIMVSGMPRNSLEWQTFAHARPGTTDTSAIPNDQVNNPGTINALINVSQRPVFADGAVLKWRKVKSCEAEKDETKCWCEPGRSGKCWQRSVAPETVHHILKGGEDSIGAKEAIQRVYFNIGSCSEQCWVNHLTDLRQLDPQQRNFGQTPFDIGQCRRDCPNFRAIEDRLQNILDFFTSAETNATDLAVARENQLRRKNPAARYTLQELTADLEKEFGKGAVGRGEKVFAANCARCHSSQADAVAGQAADADFRKVSATTGLREDFLGNDRPTQVSEVGTFTCRALHSNHMAGHVWEQYGSDAMRARAPDPNLKVPDDGGRSYYRNISLLSLWAHAPFLHNNALGPELCGNPREAANDFYAQRPRYVDPQTRQLLPPDQQPKCSEYDPSVEGRFKLYRSSMEDLLNPDRRLAKETLLTEDITVRLGARLWDGKDADPLLGLAVTIPHEIDGHGVSAGVVGNFQHKQFLDDLVMAKTRPADLETRLTKRLGAERGKQIAAAMLAVADEVVANPASLVDALKKRPYLVTEIYTSCTAEIENGGHRFGEDLSPADKQALIAFLATM